MSTNHSTQWNQVIFTDSNRPIYCTIAHFIMFKTLVQIFTVFSCVGFFLFLSACSPKNLSKGELIERSETYLKNKQPQLALDLLTTQGSGYLNDSDLLFLTAQSHLQLNDPFTASAILLSAVEADPEREKGLPSKVMETASYILGGDWVNETLHSIPERRLLSTSHPRSLLQTP